MTVYELNNQTKEQQAETRKRVNTRFDITDQMLSLSPVSYNQYQVLQQTCFHILNFNELLLIEEFVKLFFKGLRCYLDPVSREPSHDSSNLFGSVSKEGEVGKPESFSAID